MLQRWQGRRALEERVGQDRGTERLALRDNFDSGADWPRLFRNDDDLLAARRLLLAIDLAVGDPVDGHTRERGTEDGAHHQQRREPGCQSRLHFFRSMTHRRIDVANPGQTPSFRRALPETGCLSQGLPRGIRHPALVYTLGSVRNMAIASISTSSSGRQRIAWIPVDAGKGSSSCWRKNSVRSSLNAS